MTYVLIETLWNVKNSFGSIRYLGKGRVLIETLWNVKELSQGRVIKRITRINRNIVECKVYTASEAVLPAARINRNIVECKVADRFGYLE